jgi:type IV secretion system protein VirB6
MAGCPSLSTGDAFLSTLLRHIDCQGETIGSAGYQALANPGSPLSLVLTALLTIFIALFGLKMILGQTPSLRDGVMAVVRVGVVLLIATSWPAYRTVVYDVIVQGPAQLGAAIGNPAGLPGARGDMAGRLQVSDDAIVRLTTLGSGRNDLVSTTPRAADGSPENPERAPLADDLAFGLARVLFLSSIVAGFAVVKLGAGILLALAPLFAGLLLFDIARGPFIGWARALVFTLLASLAFTLILGVELALLEPWLTHALQLRQAKVITADAPVELLVLCTGFALALAGAMAILLRLAFTLHIPSIERAVSEPQASPERLELGLGQRPARKLAEGPERAVTLANAVSAAQRREASRAMAYGQGLRVAVAGGVPQSASGRAGPGLARTSTTRRRPRKSAAAALRDRRP